MEEIINCNSMTERVKKLSNYIRSHSCGPLLKEDRRLFRQLYKKFFVPDENKPFVKIVTVELENNGWGTKDFNKHFLVNKDLETENAYSIRRLAGKIENTHCKLSRAFRTEISDQIYEFKKNNILEEGAKCPINGQIIDEVHVDHIYPFSNLINDFRILHKYTDIDSSYIYYDRFHRAYYLKDPIRTEWKNYHRENAKLRYTSKAGNIKKSNKILD